jgi:hypothetical protein
LIEAEVVIQCLIQRWHAPPGAHPLSIDSETPMRFTLDRDHLICDKQRFTPIGAAEKLLADALLN